MSWESYGLDRYAQKLVLDAKKRSPDSLNQSHKMRLAVAYGLERFWGEQFRLTGDEGSSDVYWREVWKILVQVMARTGIKIDDDFIPEVQDRKNNTQVNAQIVAIESMSQKLWSLSIEDQRVSLAVLSEICDALVWWTQRYK
jgi:RNase P/RNase MRP subunit p30